MLQFLEKHRLSKQVIETVDDRLHKFIVWLDRFFVVRLIARTFAEMSHDDATHMAAGVAYYALFSIFPLLLGLVAILSFIGLDSIQENLTGFFISFLPGSENFISRNLRGVPGALGLVAVIGLFWSGSAIFGAITRAVNRAWDVHKDRPLYIGKPRQLVMALGVGLLFFLSVGATTIVEVAQEIGVSQIPMLNRFDDILSTAVVQGLSYFFTICIFLIIYKFLPNTRTYWRFVWPGAVVAAILFEFSKSLFITYLERFATFDNLYGSLSPVIVFLFWTYIVALILILGAELSSEYGRMRMGIDRGQLLHAKDERPSRSRRIAGSRVNGLDSNGIERADNRGKGGYLGRHHRAILFDETIEMVDNRPD